MNDFVSVGRLADFQDNKAQRVLLQGVALAVFRVGEEVFALHDECPHRGGPLSQGWIEGGHVFCPMHGWKFDVRTGACETNEDRPARCFAVRVVQGEVQVRIGEWIEASG
jgi:NAD(P)H-dependent nitrite reductase small subunit